MEIKAKRFDFKICLEDNSISKNHILPFFAKIIAILTKVIPIFFNAFVIKQLFLFGKIIPETEQLKAQLNIERFTMTDEK